MKVEVSELEPCKRQLVVEAPEDEVRAAWEAACDQVQREARLPGFRRGKVPRALVRSRFADEVRRAVAEALVPDAYRRALDETRLAPVEEPDVRDLQLEEGQPLRFTAVVEIKPEVPLGTYRGVGVAHAATAVTEADVEATLQHLAEGRATLVAVSRPVRVGDFATVDYEVQPEGAEPRIERGYVFEVGQGRVLPEMDEVVIGLQVGDERRVTVRFPDSHPREDLRGRPGLLVLRVVEVKEKEVPPLDDDFARSLGSHETLGALRDAVRAELIGQRERQDRRRLEEAVVDAVLAAHPFAVPEALVTREIGHRIGHARERLRRDGVDPDRLPWDYPRLAGELRPDAERAVRRALLLEAVAEREELTVSAAEVDAEIERLAREAGRAPQAMRSLLQRAGDLDGLALGLRDRKVLALLVEHAEVHPGPPPGNA
jgi:trigger factor